MTKPWEETWAIDPMDGEIFTADRTLSWERVATPASGDGVAALISAAPDMARVLLAFEWGAEDEGGNPVCPACGRGEFCRPDLHKPKIPQGHAPDCSWDAALRKAGVR